MRTKSLKITIIATLAYAAPALAAYNSWAG